VTLFGRIEDMPYEDYRRSSKRTCSAISMRRAVLRTGGDLFRPMDNYNGVDGGWRKP
jgi:hypothetical protein